MRTTQTLWFQEPHVASTAGHCARSIHASARCLSEGGCHLCSRPHQAGRRQTPVCRRRGRRLQPLLVSSSGPACGAGPKP
jgi:hypothetical protein